MANEEVGVVVNADKPGLGRMKLIIIVVVAAVLVGAGGFFAGKILSKQGEEPDKLKTEVLGEALQKESLIPSDNPAEKIEQNPTAETAKTTETAAGVETSDAEKTAGLLVLEKFTVNLNDPFGRRYAEILINLKVVKKSLVQKIQENELVLPQIRDEIFMILSSKSYPELNSVAGKITLKEEIMIRINEIIKENMNLEPIQDVFFGTFIIQ